MEDRVCGCGRYRSRRGPGEINNVTKFGCTSGHPSSLEGSFDDFGKFLIQHVEHDRFDDAISRFVRFEMLPAEPSVAQFRFKKCYVIDYSLNLPHKGVQANAAVALFESMNDQVQVLSKRRRQLFDAVNGNEYPFASQSRFDFNVFDASSKVMRRSRWAAPHFTFCSNTEHFAESQ